MGGVMVNIPGFETGDFGSIPNLPAKYKDLA